MKPRIKKINGVWHCIGQGVKHGAQTPEAAFINWKTQVDCEKGCIPIFCHMVMTDTGRAYKTLI